MKTIIMSKKDKTQNKINHWITHKSSASEFKLYSAKRMDLLIVSISGACIYLMFQFLKFFHSTDGAGIQYSTCLLKLGAISALSAIILNFISQITALKSNNKELINATNIIGDLIDGNKISKGDTNEEILAERYAKMTRSLNTASMILMLLSVSLITIFSIITF